MKRLLILFFILSTPLLAQRGNDIIYVVNDNSIIVSQTVDRVGFYVGGQYFTSYPFPYSYNQPYSFLNRFGGEVKLFDDISLMVGGYQKNMGFSYPPNQISPELWIKARVVNTITDRTNDLDLTTIVRVSEEFYYGIGIYVKW
jgi:hypothetical protein